MSRRCCREQQAHIAELAASLEAQLADAGERDVVALWRHESSLAALRFLAQLTS